jgi:hypothetical protein
MIMNLDSIIKYYLYTTFSTFPLLIKALCLSLIDSICLSQAKPLSLALMTFVYTFQF